MEGLPKPNQTVLAYFQSKKNIFMARFVDGNGWKIHLHKWVYVKENPDYWLELPIKENNNV